MTKQQRIRQLQKRIAACGCASILATSAVTSGIPGIINTGDTEDNDKQMYTEGINAHGLFAGIARMQHDWLTGDMVYAETVSNSQITDDDILLRIAMAEAEGEGVEGKALVIRVVLNRVEDDSFPNSVAEVVMQDGQFSSVDEGGRYWTEEPDEECYEALEMVESGWDESCGALYFESCEYDSWQSRNLTMLFQYGGHRFYI